MSQVANRLIRFSSFFKLLTIICLIGLLFAYLTPFVHPNTFKLLPFFGLAYPIILVFTLLFLVIWIAVRSRMSILILFVLLIGGKLHFRMIALGSEPDDQPAATEQLHVLSYNVRLFDLYTSTNADRTVNRDKIFTYLKEVNPDILCFQEFYHQDKPTKFTTRDSIIDFLEIRDYHERYAHKYRGRQNFGIAILSKYPIISKGDVIFEAQSNNDFNYCVFADIVKNEDTFRVYNVHLQSIRLQNDEYALFDGEKPKAELKSTTRLLIDKLLIAYPKRAQQARRVMEHILTSPYPTIVCGDFNDTPMSYTYHQFNKKLIDSYRNTSKGIGATYAGRVPAGRIDYIFHSKDLQSAGFSIQQETYSDHRAIHTRIYKREN
jgi:endonuclease/exonuclease/phosphatase family metal-dependent hydrolase